MIATDGIQTIANAEPRRPTASERIRQARQLREAALDAFARPAIHLTARGWEIRPLDEQRGGAANGQEWNDDRCACGGVIADSPAGDKCWDCFNFDPSDAS